MASREQLEAALIAADEAGDTEAAQLFASEIKQLSAAPALIPDNYSLGQAGKDLVHGTKLAARTGLNVLAGIPMAAADFGTGVRNLITGEGRPSPSRQFDEGLTQLGLPKPQGAVQKTGDFAAQVVLGSKLPAPQIGKPAPSNFDPQSMRLLALKKAQEAGYVVPPSTTNPTVGNKFLESWGGKIGTAQDASVRNQAVTDALVKRDLGLNVTDDVAEGTLSAIRKEAHNVGYKPVKQVGTMRLDSEYSKALDDIAAPFAKAEKAFPGLNKNEVLSTAESLKQRSVDSDTAIESIAILRDKANVAYRAGEGKSGDAFKAMAKQLENAVERSLGRRGKDAQQMLADFRSARQLIAKTHSAQKALNPELGSFDARKLAQQLNQGKMLSGGMKKAGQASQAFKEATKLMTDSGSVRNLDTVFGAGAAGLSGNPLPLLYPFTRMAARDLMLSPFGQQVLARPGRPLPPEFVMGATSGLLGP